MKFPSPFESIYDPNQIFLIIDNNNTRKFASLAMKKITLSKHQIDLMFFAKKSFLNTYWDFSDPSNITQITSKDFSNESYLEKEKIEYTNEKITGTSNKEIYQNDSSQKLSPEEIQNLKSNITNKDELINTIIENNTSMEKRTIFSKEKIIKKKQQRYKFLIWFTDTNIFNVIETFFYTDIKSINYLRMDSISTMLSNSSFLPGENTLILEETNNILTQAYAMRSNYKSKIIYVFKDKLNMKNWHLLNLNSDQRKIIGYVEYKKLISEGFVRNRLKGYFKNLVICIWNDEDILKYLIEFYELLKCSGNIVIFAKDMEILVAIDKYLLENKMATDTKIIETITREYQVLELRTHPMMNHKGFSGYVLCTYKTIDDNKEI